MVDRIRLPPSSALNSRPPLSSGTLERCHATWSGRRALSDQRGLYIPAWALLVSMTWWTRLGMSRHSHIHPIYMHRVWGVPVGLDVSASYGEPGWVAKKRPGTKWAPRAFGAGIVDLVICALSHQLANSFLKERH